MIVMPAVDVRGGRCVQLVGGDPTREAVSLADPVAVAQRWRSLGFRSLHLVDLDAALEHGGNTSPIERILEEAPGDAQVGGGIRDEAAIDHWLERGARRVIVGTRAVDDPEWLARQAEARPGRLIVAADVRDGQVLRRGWTEASQWRLLDLLGVLSSVPVAGVLITDVGREGQLVGVDSEWVESVVAACDTPERDPLRLWISGGVGSEHDIRTLSGLGVHGVVVGMALYTERISVNAIEEFMGGQSV